MAEHSFQEVMRQWVRARKAIKCRGEENDVLAVYPLEAYDDALIANIEEDVMSWAAEHPEPVYPTWREWLETQYFQTRKKVEGGHEPFNAWMNSTHIPADIAEKLGIEQKEG